MTDHPVNNVTASQRSIQTNPLDKTSLCYQCKKCSSGCPVNFEMDILPHQLMRMIQLEETEKALNSKSIWICASCMTCTTRCPNGIDIAGSIDALRHKAADEKIYSIKNIGIFHKSFLNNVKRNGRAHELSMLAAYKLGSGKLFQDLSLGAKLFFRGKLKLFPRRIKNIHEIKQIFSAQGRKK